AANLYASTSVMIIVEFELERGIYRDQSAEGKERHRQGGVAKGLRAMVKGQGITGTSILALEHLNPQEDPPPPIGSTPSKSYMPAAPGQFARMLESIEQSLHNLQKINFEGIGLEASNTLAQTTRLVEKVNRIDLQRTVGKVDTLLDDLKVTVNDVDTTLKCMK